MDWKELFDAVAVSVGRSDIGTVYRSESPQLDRQFRAIEKRAFERWKEKQSGSKVNQQIQKNRINIEITQGHFVTQNGFPLDLQCISSFNNRHYFGDDNYLEMGHCVGVFENVEYNGIDMMWNCAPKPGNIRDILMNTLGSSHITREFDWEGYHCLLDFLMREELKVLFSNDLHVMGKIEGENDYKEISIKSSDALGMGQIFKLDVFKKNYIQCYKHDLRF